MKKAPRFMRKKFNHFVRHFFRAYRNGPVRIGHSFIRRCLDPVIGKDQEIQLRSGLKLFLDMSKGNQNAIFWHDGDVDIHQYWAIRELVPLGGLFVDCGANCGLMGLLARQYRQADVIFFEPHPRLAESIRTNLRLNGFANGCEVVEAAVSDAAGEITFYENSLSDGSHSVHQDWGRELNGTMNALGKVRCVTLKDFIEKKNLARIDFLKIDTEGNDYAVLKSLGSYLQPSFAHIVYVEMTKDRQLICDLMRLQGYRAFSSTSIKRRRLVQCQQRYERGEQPAFFEPLEETRPGSGDVLWCGQNSPVANYLSELHRTAAEGSSR